MKLKTLAKSVLFRPGVRKHRIAGGALKGAWFQFDLRCDTRQWRGLYEENLQQWLAACIKPGDTCLDIGSAEGYFALLMAKLAGPSGSVHAFEMSVTAKRIPENFALNKDMPPAPLTCHNAFAGLAHDPASARVSVDGLLKAGALKSVDVVKIDVDGAEVEVLQGMAESIARFHPRLFIEVHSQQLREEVEALTALWGYSLKFELPPAYERRPSEYNAFLIS